MTFVNFPTAAFEILARAKCNLSSSLLPVSEHHPVNRLFSGICQFDFGLPSLSFIFLVAVGISSPLSLNSFWFQLLIYSTEVLAHLENFNLAVDFIYY